MQKNKYRFNPQTLRYDEVTRSFKDRLVHFLPKGIAVALMTVLLIFLLSDKIESPREKTLRDENEQLLLQYELMNKKVGEMDLALEELKKRDNNIYSIIFETEPIPDTLYGVGGVNRYKRLENLKNATIVIETSKRIDELTIRYYNVSKSLDMITEQAIYKKDFLASVPSISPLSDRNFKRFASGFGFRLHPIYKTRKMHTGIDLTAPTGTSVYATGKGVVTKVGSSTGGFGNVVMVDHGYGYTTIYAHLSQFSVKENQKLNRGDIVGTVGSTGRSVAPHLHYEVRYYDKPVNPINYYFNDLTPEEYDRIVEISQRPTQSLD